MTTTRQFGTITDEALDHLRSLIGTQVTRTRPHVEVLTRDAIRHWAEGIGDRNPLWSDPEYAATTAYGHVLAPPTMLFAADRVLSGYVTGLPGIHAMFAGADFRFRRRLHEGDVVRGAATLSDLIERDGRFAGRAIQQVYEVPFVDASGQEVAVADSWCFRTERDTARERGKYSSEDEQQTRWTPQQIDELAARVEAQEERRRGPRPRYIDDVEVGQELPEIVKGPYTATTAIAFLLGWGGLYVRAHGHAFDLYQRHPALAIPNEWGVPEPPERVHWDPDLARRVGVPGAYDYGPERVAWMGQVATDWMGDAGFLQRLRVEVRRHNLIGDLVVCQGVVTDVDHESGVVHARLEAHDQEGNESARGTAQIVLPHAADDDT